MGNSTVVFMLAVLCSIIANTAPDAEGKQFVYRRPTGAVSKIASIPDRSMMRPEDFMPKYALAGLEDEASEEHGLSDRSAEEMIRSLFPNAIDTRPRKTTRSEPRGP
jgi:hypothetical protein